MAILGPGNGTLQNGILTNVTSIPSFIAAGTRMIFEQTAAPTSWTKVTTLVNNCALRVTTGTAAPGGSVAFTTVFGTARAVSGTNVAIAGGGTVAQQVSTGSVNPGGANIDGASLSVAQLASHSHPYQRGGPVQRGAPSGAQISNFPYQGASTGDTGQNGAHGHGSPAHAHPFAGAQHAHTFAGAQHAHPFAGAQHVHPWSGSANLEVLYVDVIIATKN